MRMRSENVDRYRHKCY